jgi:xanthine dehydrogenase small subunit
LSLANASGWRGAVDAVSKDFTPLTDLRASAGYRSRVAGNLIVKALAEIAGVSPQVTRVVDHRILADAAE